MIENTITQALSSRYTSKAFIKGQTIDQFKLQAIIESANFAPTSFGLQPFKIINISAQDLKDKIATIGFNQAQFSSCSSILVFAIETDLQKALEQYKQRIIKAGRQDEQGATGFMAYINGFLTNLGAKQQPAWSAKQAYIALGFALQTASLLNVASAPMEGFNNKQLDELLGLEALGLNSQVILTLGVEDPEDKNKTAPKVRKTLEEFVLKI
jgi:nitroreductase / dihydropteridine reductase